MQITPHANCRDYIWGSCRLEIGGNPPKTNFKQVLNNLSGFENYTFFDFQKKFFSLHPNVDDTFVIIHKNSVEEFLDYLNTIENSIKFTIKKEADHTLPF